MKTFRELYGDDLANSIDQLKRQSGATGETRWERDKRAREAKEERDRLISLSQACLLGEHGQAMALAAEKLLGSASPEWPNVNETTLKQVQTALRASRS